MQCKQVLSYVIDMIYMYVMLIPQLSDAISITLHPIQVDLDIVLL